MKKILLFLTLSSIFINCYADVTSSLFQNSFNTDLSSAQNIPAQTSSNKEQLLNKTVAIVNSKPITSFELDQEVAKLQASQPNTNFNSDPLEIKRQALQDLIAQSVLIQLAEQNNIMISPLQVDAAIKDIAAKNGVSVESLKLNIEGAGMSFDSYKKRIKDQLMVNQLQQQAISQQVYVSPEEIQKYIQKHKKQFDKEMAPVRLYSLRNLIVTLPDSKKARQKKIDLYKKLAIAVNKGYIDFTELAKQFSQAPNSASGGLLSQNIKFDAIRDIYKDHVKGLKQHQVSKPFLIKNTLQMVYIDNLNEQAPMLSKKITKYYVYAIEIKLDGSMTEEGAKNSLDRAKLAIESGQDFSKVAEKYNQDYDHPDGDFKWVSQLDSPPSLPPAAFAQLNQLKKGELSEPFQADSKTWMIMKYTKVKKFDAAEQLKEQKALEAIFAEKAQEVYKTWLTSMKDDAYIEILENDLKTPELY
ncbi:peptidylprolyl isomerase [Candidatus Francisella endociliophora]|uniref:Peptidylprolyl isomerase n=1 Tax=Candidatus Francisella endociliophora TaxID=653937 RepID=A0A097ENM2_9GAMM|nr:peptidylprolyl isomerase [Francisella sp. FSC1006]AIT09159.1 peptidylprolyl isomerase [Francisella sp. FSC1006]